MGHEAGAGLPRSLPRRSVLALSLAAALPGCAARRAEGPSPARRAVLHAQSLVTRELLGPTDAARLYAYVTTVFRDASDAAGPVPALLAARRTADALVAALPATARGGPRPPDPPRDVRLPAGVRVVVDGALARAEGDGRDDETPARPRPQAPGTWAPQRGTAPTTPGAGRWRLWSPGAWPDVPAPPPPGSPQDEAECERVRAAVAARTPAQEARVRHWRAGPGTVTPAGMWLDLADAALADAPPGVRAEEPAVLALTARTVADAARECWRVKYTYWTARPSRRMPGLRTTNADPPFPAYTSGHSTMSAAAATVLAAVLPHRAEALLAAAREARDSRLVAGIHFPCDNDAGFALGVSVARAALGSRGRPGGRAAPPAG